MKAWCVCLRGHVGWWLNAGTAHHHHKGPLLLVPQASQRTRNFGFVPGTLQGVGPYQQLYSNEDHRNAFRAL